MNSLKFWSEISQRKLSLLHTRDIADLLGISIHSAGKYLEALRQQNLVEKLNRGKWAVLGPELDVLRVAEFLTSPRESYISLHSALFHHGMIEQIPARIYAVTVDRSKVVRTPIGIYSFHHCHPDFFTGYDYLKPFLKIASPEKSLVDYFYFTPAKSRQFNRLPELHLPPKFSWKKAEGFCFLVPSPRTRSLVLAKLNSLRASLKK